MFPLPTTSIPSVAFWNSKPCTVVLLSRIIKNEFKPLPRIPTFRSGPRILDPLGGLNGPCRGSIVIVVLMILNVTFAGMPIIAASSSAARKVHLCAASSQIPSIDSSTSGVFGSSHGYARESSAAELTTADTICARRWEEGPAANQQQRRTTTSL